MSRVRLSGDLYIEIRISRGAICVKFQNLKGFKDTSLLPTLNHSIGIVVLLISMKYDKIL